MTSMMSRIALMSLAVISLPGFAVATDTWKAGVAKANITPQTPLWMAGYASRTRPADGKMTELWAKALALEDAGGKRAVLVTLDLVGIDAGLSNAIRDELEKKHGLKRSDVAINCSHTHSGPVVAHNLRPMHFYALDKDQQELVKQYADRLQTTVVEIVGKALASLEPATLAWGSGQTDVAVNRRNNKADAVPGLRAENKLAGPFDHDVPVLAVKSEQGGLLAVAFGYACHATVLDGYEWSGDYPGYAQIELEKSHPDCVALFWAGCGADQNPLPRRQRELAEKYGKQLAAAVDKVLAQPLAAVAPQLKTTYAEIDLPLDVLPTRDELVAQTKDANKYIVMRAKMLLEDIDAGQPLSQTYPYPVQTWKLGGGQPEGSVQWIFLGGEVVVDYPLRLKTELAARPLTPGPSPAKGEGSIWVAGYTNDVMAYIPSRRVLLEGGYEGVGAMVYYGLPTAWSPEVETKIVAEVLRQAGQ